MAKASDKDIDALNTFFQELERAVEDDEYEPLPHEKDREYVVDPSDERLANFVRDWWRKRLRGSWGRVVHGCDHLIRNVCDESLPHLDWKPEIKAALEKGGYTDI